MAMPEVIDAAPEPQFVGVQYVATTTGLSRGSIYSLVGNGTIRSVWYGTRRLIPVEELNRFVNELRSQVK